MADTDRRDTGPEDAPGTDPEAGPGTDPEAGPGTDPEDPPGTDPEDAPEPDPEDAPEPDPEDAPEPDPAAGPEAGPKAADGARPRWKKRLRRIALAVLLILLVPLLTAEAALRVTYMGDPADGTHTRDRDAMWLGHAWVDGRKTDADLTALARELKTTGIRDLYVHTGPMEHDGTLPESLYPNARRFVEGVHRELPGVRVQAFLGDVLATESPDGMRLEKASTRAAVVGSARQVLDAGYDGVHLDLEPLHSGDRDYLSLLDDVRAVTRARDARLSVAAHQIDPLPGFHSFWGTVAGHPKWWSQEFFGQVARRVDQIAVMSYDTMQPLESLYGGYVAQQTSLALEATPPTTHLLMGLPFYHENRFGHWNHAETVAAAVRGVRLGLSRTDAGRERFGVAAYIDFAATEEDWASYRDGWVR
ncbi:hypothetical protein [Streptomyces ardesiacus]|uniref:GH18 domain-containing protein n=1 Tax=Streptomyces ardesiacus TaxID=285564 RepID=A0ABW8H4B1_9ACTN